MKKKKDRNKTVVVTISLNSEMKEKVDARAAQLGRDRSNYFVWLALKDLGLIPDESFNPKAISAIIEVLEQRELKQQRHPRQSSALLNEDSPQYPAKGKPHAA
jgi:predicted transcriptional regulator